MQDRKSIKSIEQAIKEAEQLVAQSSSLDHLEKCLGKAAEGIQFQEAKISFYQNSSRLGVKLGEKNPEVGKIVKWSDPEQAGFFPRNKEFSAQFSIAGRNFSYGMVEYVFIDGRKNLSVQDEVLLERIHDSVSSLASRLRKSDEVN